MHEAAEHLGRKIRVRNDYNHHYIFIITAIRDGKVHVAWKHAIPRDGEWKVSTSITWSRYTILEVLDADQP